MKNVVYTGPTWAIPYRRRKNGFLLKQRYSVPGSNIVDAFWAREEIVALAAQTEVDQVRFSRIGES